MDGCGWIKLHAMLVEIPETCRALDGGDHGTQCATEVKQSHMGSVEWCGYSMEGARRNSVRDQSVENALEQVEDTMSELCGQSTDANVKKYRFCGQETVGAERRSPRHWARIIVLRALRYDAVILASTTLRERKEKKIDATTTGRRATSEKELGRGASVFVEFTKVFAESHLDKRLLNFSPETPPDPSGSDNPYGMMVRIHDRKVGP